MGTGRFQLSEAESSPGWLEVPRGQEQTETEEYGISHFVYRRDRPFHAERLSEAINGGFGEGQSLDGVLRSKGIMWIASRNDWAYDWSQAGCSIRMNPAGFWWAAAPQDEWPEDEESMAEIQSKLNGLYGDRHQELVLIGHRMNQARITERLDQCLVTEVEYTQGPDAWAGFNDPFPPIELETEDDDALEVWR